MLKFHLPFFILEACDCIYQEVQISGCANKQPSQSARAKRGWGQLFQTKKCMHLIL